MSTHDSRSKFAFRTAFDALPVDSGEESEEEQVSEVSPEPPAPVEGSQPEVPVKPSKTAQKKAAKAARLEKKQQKARAKSPTSGTAESSAEDVEKPSPGSALNPVEVPSETENESAPGRPNDDETTSQSAGINGSAGARAKPKYKATPVAQPQPKSESVSATESEHVTAPSIQQRTERMNGAPPRQEIQKAPEETKEAVEKDGGKKESEKKRQSFLVRTLWSFIMIGGFISLLLMGHAYMILLVMICQTAVYREVTALFALTGPKSRSEDEPAEGRDPWSKTLNWYFFIVTNYFLYGESIIYYFKHVVFADAQLLPFATNHRIISFSLYTIGFVGFVGSLKKGYLKQQFGLFCWVHMSLLMIVVSSHFIVNNILEGLIWFWYPASLVICNDVFAYVWGITCGRTPLIKLSPKKTVEGFVGAFFSTLIFGVIWGSYFMRFDYMICPVRDLGVSAWSQVGCDPNSVFVWREWEIFTPLRVVLSTLLQRPVTTISYAPYQIHALFMACFASLVAPFGGFFASGFKRAFDIKDFGHSIPGHGGMTDRMDCQFLMGVFTYVYYSSLIRQHHVTVGSALQMIVSGLTIEEQLELIGDLKRYLEGQGIQVPSL